MPSQITHLAIAKRYLEKHPRTIKDVQRFLDGNVLPDLALNKELAHCGDRSEKYDILKHNREKVNPNKFMATHDMRDDLNKGQYLHLYVDHKYYNEFLLDYFKNTSGDQVSTDMYETTRRDDAYLRRKYEVSYCDTTVGRELQMINDAWDIENYKKRRQSDSRFNFPYDFAALSKFIENMADTLIPQNNN